MFRKLLATTALAALMTIGAFAASATITKEQLRDQTMQATPADGYLVSRLKGQAVYTTDEDGKPVSIGVGGFLGIGEKPVALDAGALKVMRDGSGNIAIRTQVAAQADPFASQPGSRIDVEGPVIRLDADAAIGLGMILHELAINAAKYGALSVVDGKVAIALDNDAERISVTRREIGGPPVVKPEQGGFGSIPSSGTDSTR